MYVLRVGCEIPDLLVGPTGDSDVMACVVGGCYCVDSLV